MNRFFSLVIFLLLVNSGSQAQILSGTVPQCGRKMTSDYTFEIQGKYQGFLTFELAVNPEGKVTGVRFVKTDGDLISTPARILATNQVSDLLFEKGTSYPKIQHATVRVNFIKKTN